MADVDLLQQQCCKCRGLPRFDNRVTARLDFITALFNNNYSQMARLSSPFVHRTEVAAHLAEVSHENLFRRFESWLPEVPPLTTIRVNLLRSSIERVKRLVQQAFIDKYGNDEHLQFVTNPQIPELLGIAPMVEALDNLTELDKEIVVDCSCGASCLRGANIYAPGVLAMTKNAKVGERVRVVADLAGKCKKGTDFYDSSNKLFLGTGIIKQQRFQLYGSNVVPSGIAVEMLSTTSGVPCLGDAYLTPEHGILQNLPSILCSRALHPKPGDTVLDMCSSPGNKTTHLLELMQDEGILIAVDKVERKVDSVRRKITELKYKSVRCFAFDSTKCVDGSKTESNIEDGPPFAKHLFDKVLLDAPCSATGNRPQFSNKITAKMLASYPELQKQLFYAAHECLKPGGTMVYSTCSIMQAENEGIVSWALNKFPDLELQTIDGDFGDPGWPTAGLTSVQLHQMKRFGPPSTDIQTLLADSVGFFIAKFMKTKN